MKKNALKITAKSMLALSIVTGALFVASSKRNGVSLVKADSSEEKLVLTVDPNHYWGNGAESYKVAACFSDNDSHEAWSDLVLVEAPNRFVSLSYELDFTPTSVSLYRYAPNLEEDVWNIDRKANHYDDPCQATYSSTPNNIILSSDTYGIYKIPMGTRQEYLPDSGSYQSHDKHFSSVALNEESHNTEYSVQVSLSEKDGFYILGDPLFADIHEDRVTYGDGMNPLDLEFWENTSGNRGFDCNVAGTYNFAFDYNGNRLTVTKEVEPTPVDPEDPTDPEDLSGGDTPSEDPSEKGEGGSTSLNISIKDILKIIAKTFRDAWNDLVAHIKRWFKLN